MNIIDGKVEAQKIKDSVKSKVEKYASIKPYLHLQPHLVVIQVGDNPDSSTYVKNKEKACEYCGIKVSTVRLTDQCRENTLLNIIEQYNVRDCIDGILVQLPLPDHIDELNVLNAISPKKDVNGFHPINVAKLWTNDKTAIVPCTPKGIIKLIESTNVSIEGKKAVVVGYSNIVGKPVAKLLMDKGATVTICHNKTTEETLNKELSSADIIVMAISKPKFLNLSKFTPKSDCIIIDAGINRTEDGKLVGDVDFEEVKDKVGYITPVPGGVDPMTIACLMENTFDCFNRKIRF